MATVKSDNSGPVFKAIREALAKEVLVGIPDTAAERKPAPGEKGTPPSNALVGYVQEFGEPSKNIPARPFLVPGVASIQGEVVSILTEGITGAFMGKASAYDNALEQVGHAAVTAVKKQMTDGTFAPLSQRTIEARATRRNKETGKLLGDGRSRDARRYLKLQEKGTPEWALNNAGLAKPLLDTYSLYTSINFVIRDKRN